ncbi:hypothetical protein [Parvibaculum sp.]|uniref:hypothetical protein n=1 Tax=Parvibaculum sp. TaxID=2024848 RepID=UPI0027301808|nr:hypothetical protein [Parvibaculum sp.]MDP1628830.1 hypothetical protein [Parvibaculum sp.]MDP2148225.1 hypothetical protein [Parvibaculum sp.]MDP3327710.1 hypothetical protein [Parvibaculum sp.]
MADLLAYPLDDTKRYRLARAAAGARSSRDARTIGFCVELLDDLMASRPGIEGEYPALALARWMTDANALLNSIKLKPAQVRMDTSVTERCLQIKGLVSEAELHCLPAMDIARRENDALAERLIARAEADAATPPQIVSGDLTLPQGEGGKGGARRAPRLLFESTPGVENHAVRERFLKPATLSHDLVLREDWPDWAEAACTDSPENGSAQSGWPVFEHPTLSAAGPDGPRAGAAGPVPHSAGRCAVRLALAGLAAALFARLVSRFRALLPDPLAGLFHESRRSPHARNPKKNPKNNNAGFTEGTIAPHRPRVMRKNRDDFHAGQLHAGTPFDDGSAA